MYPIPSLRGEDYIGEYKYHPKACRPQEVLQSKVVFLSFHHTIINRHPRATFQYFSVFQKNFCELSLDLLYQILTKSAIGYKK